MNKEYRVCIEFPWNNEVSYMNHKTKELAELDIKTEKKYQVSDTKFWIEERELGDWRRIDG